MQYIIKKEVQETQFSKVDQKFVDKLQKILDAVSRDTSTHESHVAFEIIYDSVYNSGVARDDAQQINNVNCFIDGKKWSSFIPVDSVHTNYAKAIECVGRARRNKKQKG